MSDPEFTPSESARLFAELDIYGRKLALLLLLLLEQRDSAVLYSDPDVIVFAEPTEFLAAAAAGAQLRATVHPADGFQHSPRDRAAGRLAATEGAGWWRSTAAQRYRRSGM